MSLFVISNENDEVLVFAGDAGNKSFSAADAIIVAAESFVKLFVDKHDRRVVDVAKYVGKEQRSDRRFAVASLRDDELG